MSPFFFNLYLLAKAYPTLNSHVEIEKKETGKLRVESLSREASIP